MLFFLVLALPFVVAKGGVDISTHDNGYRTCTVFANGNEKNDVRYLNEAFKECASDATVVFPEDQTYFIDEKLHATLHNVNLDWRGEWLFSNDTAYWRDNSYFIEFQNHRAGFVLSGDNIRLNGHGTGGIDGNGDVWYDEDQGTSTVGRPMNITDSTFDNFSIVQSQFWSLNIMNGTNLAFENITCSAFSNNSPEGANWVQNADGFNTMDARNITLTNFVYRGGDDCIAIKPRSYDIMIRNLTCEGGNGIAIGSLGQYLEDNTVENVTISDAKMIRTDWDMRWSVYIKTWMGHLVHQGEDDYESGGLPRGGGWGKVRNLLFENFMLENVSRGPYITQNNGDTDNKTYAGTSKMEISNIIFRNFTGSIVEGEGKVGEISCSNVYPCYDIWFENMDFEAEEGSCRWADAERIFGLPGCSE